MLYMIVRQMTIDGVWYRMGSLASLDGSRNLNKLLKLKYVVEYDGDFVECSNCGRKFVDNKSLNNHLEVDNCKQKISIKQEDIEVVSEESKEEVKEVKQVSRKTKRPSRK